MMKISADIGTSYSSCCVRLPNGDVIPLKLRTGPSAFGSDTSIPSAVFFKEGGKPLLGQAAMNSRMVNPENFHQEFKRALGKGKTITLGGKTYQPEYFYTLFFRHMKNRLQESYPNEPLECCYLTCPVNFNEHQRQLVIAAAQEAGFFKTELIHEPVAAVQGCRSLLTLRDGDVLLVYDFGGGTFDAALVKYEKGSFQALGAKGLSNCGGSDIDWRIYQDILSRVPADLLNSVKEEKTAYSRFAFQLMETAVNAKQHLSDYETFDYELQIGRSKLSYTLSRDRLEGMIAGMVADTITCCRNLLQEAGIAPQNLAQVLRVGGTSRIPMVKRKLEELVGTVPVTLAEDPELAVARGALFHDVSQDTWKMYQQGREFEKKNMPGIAFGYYQQAAQAGIAEAQHALAKLHQTGIDGFMKPDPVQAEHWYCEAAQQEHVDAMYQLAELYRNGKDHPKEAYLDLYRKAAEKGHRDAQFRLGQHLPYGDVDQKKYWYTKAARQGHTGAMRELGDLECEQQNFENAIKWCTLAVKAGDPDAIDDLAYTYEEMGNHEDAVKWYLQAAEKNSMSAWVYESLGRYCEQGIVLEKSREDAIKWYLCAAERKKKPVGPIGYQLGTLYEETGDYASAAEWYGKVEWGRDRVEDKAQCALARLYYEGRIPGKGVLDAKKLFLKLAEKDFPEAQYRLGLYYEEGAEGYPNFKEAEEWYDRARWNKNKEAQYKLGCIKLDKMQGADNPYAEKYYAMSYLEDSAKQGYVPALNRYGAILCDDGELDAAAEWLQKSAEQGDPEGLFHLALIYYNDSYSGYDEEKYRKLLRRSAEAGYFNAQDLLGYDYLTRHKNQAGKAPNPEDIALGLMWYRKAAEQGNAKVQRYFANILQEGRIVEQDLIEAEKWYRKSAEQGDQISMEYLASLLELEHPEEAELWQRRALEKDLERDSEAPRGLWYNIPRAEWYRRHARYEEAFNLYNNAANAGVASALFAVAEFFEQGLYVSKSKGNAESYYKKAYNAHSWDPKSKIRQESAYRLARYYEGITFPFPKKKLTEEWYRKAAEAGHEGAQHWLEAKQKNT